MKEGTGRRWSVALNSVVSTKEGKNLDNAKSFCQHLSTTQCVPRIVMLKILLDKLKFYVFNHFSDMGAESIQHFSFMIFL